MTAEELLLGSWGSAGERNSGHSAAILTPTDSYIVLGRQEGSSMGYYGCFLRAKMHLDDLRREMELSDNINARKAKRRGWNPSKQVVNGLEWVRKRHTL